MPSQERDVTLIIFFSFHGLCCRLSVQDLFTKGLLSEHHLVNNLKYNIMFTDMYIPL